MDIAENDKYDLFGVPLTNLKSYSHALDSIVQRIKQSQKTFCVAINPEKIHRAQGDPELLDLLNSADFHICDGIGAALAIRLMYGKKIARVTGVQLFYYLMELAEKEGFKVFLLGASSESNIGSCTELKKKHPQLKIVGSQDGYFKDDRQVIEHINASQADMLFVAMGSPKQEIWVSRYRNEINAPYCMGVGGTFDVVSGNVKWAPVFFRKTGTEFLYRLICDPRRIKRQACYPIFMLKVLKVRMFGKAK